MVDLSTMSTDVAQALSSSLDADTITTVNTSYRARAQTNPQCEGVEFFALYSLVKKWRQILIIPAMIAAVFC